MHEGSPVDGRGSFYGVKDLWTTCFLSLEWKGVGVWMVKVVMMKQVSLDECSELANIQ